MPRVTLNPRSVGALLPRAGRDQDYFWDQAATAPRGFGVRVSAPPAVVERCLDEAGIGFFFAPTFHPSMRHAGPARRALGVRTAFNLLGPLTNPARAARQLVGVPRPEFTELIARALLLLGCERAWVVHGADGIDEISTAGYTKVSECRDGAVHTFYLHPADVGVAMGKRGTEVAKQAADIVLSDDNFATIVAAVEEGRSIKSNIRRFASYVFTSNVAELVPFVLYIFLPIPLPLAVIQVLAIDVGTDLLPALALGAEYVDLEWKGACADLMARTGGRRVVLSHHDFTGVPADLPAIATVTSLPGSHQPHTGASMSRGKTMWSLNRRWT